LKLKYILLFSAVAVVNWYLFMMIDRAADKSVEYERQLLIKQAKAHFDDQVNNRGWNAEHGGVYVYPKPGQSPNPYLTNNQIKDEHGKMMIKINPAWMTRQLSELAKIDGYHFRITSLTPLNPSNKPNRFEERALRAMLDGNETKYYEFDDETEHFKYMGALITKPACMPCHQHQGYRVGDIRGGISVDIDSREHFDSRDEIRQRQTWQKVIAVVASFIVLFLIMKIFRHQETLEASVMERTLEINRTKMLLQAVLDAELSFLVVADEHNVIYVNQTLLNFFGYASQEEFEADNVNIIDFFEYEETSDATEEHQTLNWIEQLLLKQQEKSPRVIVKRGRQNRFFRPHAKEIEVDGKKLFLIIFDEITEHVEEKRTLETIASTDTLTGLANRSKFDQVLVQQAELSETTGGPLSLIFADIDFFKKVNDDYGHAAGDRVLKEVAQILVQNVRKGDLVARWGGEEFVVILQSTEGGDAVKLAEKMRRKVAEHSFGDIGTLSISCGVTQFNSGEHVSDFVNRADEALYQAKESGRNQTLSK
jgi:diguanylate cyclase (GGDEF)-like protein